jgi:chorismate dehydratase
LLTKGEIDLCPSSSIEYGKSYEKYLLLPDLSISSWGAVNSVFLFSRIPLNGLDGATVCLTSESETSVALLKIILTKYCGFTNSFVSEELDETDSVLNTYPAALLIGNTAMKWAAKRSGLYRYDLGEVWKSLTGLPFVFALWIIREDAVTAKRNEVSLISERLKQAKKIAFTLLEEIAAECSERFWIGKEELLYYWKNISYDMTPHHVHSLQTFFRYAKDIGILKVEPELRFFRST